MQAAFQVYINFHCVVLVVVWVERAVQANAVVTALQAEKLPYVFDYKAVTIIRRGCYWRTHEKEKNICTRI